MVILYLHVMACIWWLVVENNEDWISPIESADFDNLYENGIGRQYWIVLYYSIQLMAGNDIQATGNFVC